MIHKPFWKISFWILLAGWIVGAGLNMARVHGGFLTNYLSDVAFPPWFYIYTRGLWQEDKKLPRLAIVGDWFGRTPERAFFSILLVGTFTEVKTYYWPTGIITGTFDPLDILAYCVGLTIFYYLDKRGMTRSAPTR
jgi:hypothetical protein